MLIQILIAFTAMFCLDVVFAFYTKSVVANKPVVAGLLASAIILCNTVMVLEVVHDQWMVVPTALGAFAGTWTAVRWHL